MTICTKCKESLQRILLRAMLQDMGCIVYPPADRCSADDGAHDFGDE